MARPFDWTPEKRAALALICREEGISMRQVAARVKVSWRTVQGWIRRRAFARVMRAVWDVDRATPGVLERAITRAIAEIAEDAAASSPSSPARDRPDAADALAADEARATAYYARCATPSPPRPPRPPNEFRWPW